MRLVRMSIAAMAVALLTMLLCMVSFSPLKMAVFMSVGMGSAGLGLVLFSIALVRGLSRGVQASQR